MPVLNKHRDHIPNNSVYIGRGSIWGNPFVIGKDGDRDEVCDKYETYLDHQIESGNITNKDLKSLQGKDLVCYCSPCRCHGDYLNKIVNQEVFKVIIAGGRDYTDEATAIKKIDPILINHPEYEMVTGCAGGADQIPYWYKDFRGIHVEEFPADWNNILVPNAIVKYGRNRRPYNAHAGFDRNLKMALYADALIAFWDGRSTGTKNMIDVARAHGLQVRVIRY